MTTRCNGRLCDIRRIVDYSQSCRSFYKKSLDALTIAIQSGLYKWPIGYSSADSMRCERLRKRRIMLINGPDNA